ncbi:MAG: AtpZ/AtpI family protein [Acidobacteriota bacterium]
MALRPTTSTGEALRAAGALSTVGLAFVLALVIGFWIGDRLDAWLGTAPLLTIVFFFLGLAAGIVNVYRIVSQSFPGGNPSGSPASETGHVAAVPTTDRTDVARDPDGDSEQRW